MNRDHFGWLHACGRWLRSLPAPSTAQLNAWSAALAYAGPDYVACVPPPPLSDLTDEQLCLEWRASYVALQGPVSHRQLIRIVRERQGYLDELERRSPQGFTAWLASGAWASSTPLPYLTENPPDDQLIDWDELFREHGT